ncbi:MAG: hypothetical protein V1775_16680 [Bacteroidota bacterium]
MTQFNEHPQGFVLKLYSSDGKLIQEDIQLEPLIFKSTEFYYTGKIKLQYTKLTIKDLYYGDYIEYYENGNKKFHGTYDAKGFEVGEWKWYNQDGSINVIKKYKKEIEYYSNGKVKAEGSYIFDDNTNKWERTGNWYFNTDDGKFNEMLEYKFGILQEKK